MAARTQVLKSTDTGSTWQDITTGLPYGYYDAIRGDGINLYTWPSFPTGANNGDGSSYTLPEDGSRPAWQLLNSQKTCSNSFCNGPASMAYDPVNHLLYSANWLAGVWRLQTSSNGAITVPERPRGLKVR